LIATLPIALANGEATEERRDVVEPDRDHDPRARPDRHQSGV
jgi:hypothetical protein